jgi:arsenate reductase-like glutaredoxin family protein
MINLSPPIDESCFEVEWAIVHLVETYEDTEDLQRVLDKAEDGEVNRLIQTRLDNYNEHNLQRNANGKL